MNENIESLIKIVKEDSNEALGCTEPVAVAYCGNILGEYFTKKNSIEYLDIKVSKNIYKNGKSVKIPKTGLVGLDLAASIGFLTPKTEYAFMVFSDLNSDILNQAKLMIDEGRVKVCYQDNLPDIYVEARTLAEDKEVIVIISDSHTHLSKIKENGKIIYEDEYNNDDNKENFDIKKLSFEQIRKITEDTNEDELKFTLRGVEVNKKAATEGLKGYGSNLGKILLELKRKGVLSDSTITDTRIYTAAAADIRMGGGDCPIMTSGGSGNQGIGVILPIAIVAETENISDGRLAKALFYAHLINRYVKEYSGKLSGICGCSIGAAVGATAGITWMLGGSDEQIAGACSNIYANLTGIICDGAKESCSMKLSTSAAESVISAYLAVNGLISDANVGVIGNNIEETIANIGKLSRQAFTKVDEIMLEIIEG